MKTLLTLLLTLGIAVLAAPTARAVVDNFDGYAAGSGIIDQAFGRVGREPERPMHSCPLTLPAAARTHLRWVCRRDRRGLADVRGHFRRLTLEAWTYVPSTSTPPRPTSSSWLPPTT